MTDRQIEMTWRCSSCGHQNLGRDKLCAGCGDPKDASEKFEMPRDTARAPSVTDPELLRHAKAGADWRCQYCGSDQRRLDGECARCGAARAGAAAGAVMAQPAMRAVPRARRSWAVPAFVGLCGAALLGMCGVVVLTKARRPYVEPPPFQIVVARVQSVSWERAVHVERFKVWRREGFAETRPADAFDVESLGQREHHQEQVPDGFDTEWYDEQVPDGFATETYTETVNCGQDCTPIPQSCTETCTPNDNGFATCTTTCSGGGESCTPRTCTENRTRQVPRTRTERRSRQVPRFRSEPRYAEWFAWSVRDWGHDRVLRASGTTPADLRWPSEEEIHLSQGLAEGEQERERREERFHVVLALPGGETRTVTPASPNELARYAVGSEQRVRLDRSGAFSVLGPPTP